MKTIKKSENKMKNPEPGNNTSAAPKVKNSKNIKGQKIKIIGPVAWLGYPYNIGQIVVMNKLQADELIIQKVAEKF